MASSNRSSVQELCWDPHKSVSLQGGGRERGALESFPSGSGAVQSSGVRAVWLAGALALHKGRCLFWVVQAALSLGIRRPGLEPG